MFSHLNPRTRFIGLVTTLYIGLGLAWILLSDRFLSDLVAPDDVLGLSLAKGVVFVLASGAALLLALRAVPPRLPATQFASASASPRALLAHGAKPNVVSTAGVTPVMGAAIHSKSAAIVRLLIEAGADVNAIIQE